LLLASCYNQHTVTVFDGNGNPVSVALKTDSATGTMDRENMEILCKTVAAKAANANNGSLILDKNCQFIAIKDPAGDGFCIQVNYATPTGFKNTMCKWDKDHRFLSQVTF
jgi:hypothetical protein